jgi:hypothetical protein
MVTKQRTQPLGIPIPVEAEFHLLFTGSGLDLEATQCGVRQPPRGCPSAISRPGVNLTTLSNARAVNAWSYTSTPIRLHGVNLHVTLKQRVRSLITRER